MKRRASATGYTILEVMIVMTVTAAMFVSVVALFGGRQGQAETTQSVRDFESKVQTIANSIANGYYSNGFSCTGDDVGSRVALTTAVNSVGANKNCVFLGKAVAFNKDSAEIFTMVGRQFTGAVGSIDVATLSTAKPTAVAQSGGPDVTETYSYRYSLKVTKMVNLSDNTTPVGAIAFLSQLSGGVGGGSPVTGGRSTLLYGLNFTSTPDTDPRTITATKLNDATQYTLIPKGVRLCLRGGDGKKAEITIGANGSQTATYVSIDNGVNSVCP